jgi:autotransporter-associated beta strand protein
VNLTYANVGRLDLNGSTRTFNVSAVSTNGVAVAPLQPTLEITAPILSTGGPAGISKTGTGLLQLSGQNLFTGGVSVSAGGLVIGSSSNANAAASAPGMTVSSGPVGTGTLTMAANTTLISTAAANTLANPVVMSGNVRFDGINSLTLNGATTLPATQTINVVYPSMVATLGGQIGGTHTIDKDGLGALSFSTSYLPSGELNNNTISSTSVVNVNQGTLRLVGPAGATSAAPFGQGDIVLKGGTLDLRSNGASSEGIIRFYQCGSCEREYGEYDSNGHTGHERGPDAQFDQREQLQPALYRQRLHGHGQHQLQSGRRLDPHPRWWRIQQHPDLLQHRRWLAHHRRE